MTPDGTTLTPVLGPRLDGVAFALIRDTDGGAHDGDTAYDRAVGPMRFTPSTWVSLCRRPGQPRLHGTPRAPRPVPSRAVTEPVETEDSQLPLPTPDIEPPDDDLLSHNVPLTSNSAESMTATPSTTADTRR